MTIIFEALLDTLEKHNRDRQIAYSVLDATLQNLVVAMYEAYVEDRPESLEKIKLMRARVKAAYPKPDEL